MGDLKDQVLREIEVLHAVFEAWLRGTGDSLDRVEAALGEHFTIVPPRGGLVRGTDLLAGLEQARGTRQIRIRVENVQVRWQAADAVLATYEEWHEHAAYTTTRQSTVLFTVDDTTPGGLLWQHVHETWITPPPTWIVPPLQGDEGD